MEKRTDFYMSHLVHGFLGWLPVLPLAFGDRMQYIARDGWQGSLSNEACVVYCALLPAGVIHYKIFAVCVCVVSAQCMMHSGILVCGPAYGHSVHSFIHRYRNSHRRWNERWVRKCIAMDFRVCPVGQHCQKERVDDQDMRYEYDAVSHI